MTPHEQALEVAANAMATADTSDGPAYKTLFDAGLKAYLAALNSVLVPRVLDRKMLTVADRAQGHLSKYGIKILWSALIAELDAREKSDG